MRTLFLLPLVTTLHAAELTLEWDPNAPADQVTKYSLYEVVASPDFKLKLAEVSGQLTTLTFDFSAGPHEIVLTASNALGIESGPSNAVQFTVPHPPTGLRIKIAVQASEDMLNWQTIASIDDAVADRKFYRLVFPQ